MDTDAERSDTDSDAYSMASAPYTISSYDGDVSMRSSSPRSMVLSVTSSMRDKIYKEEFGRNLNNYSDVYRLPADEEELERLDKQHSVLSELMGGKYPAPMLEIMADEPGEIKACLDLGCGSGNWIMDVARDFPHCIAVGTDLIPMQSPNMPLNVRSEVDDINLGLEHFYGDYNVVQARLISSGIRDYNHLIDQMSRVLRPGGLISVSEFDFHVYDANHRRIERDVNDLTPPWWSVWFTHLWTAIVKSGGDVDAANHLHEWILDHPMFEDVAYKEIWVPAVPHTDTSNDSEEAKQLEKKLTDDGYAFLRSGRPLLLGYGFDPEVISMIEEKVMKEREERKLIQYTRLQCVYARKRKTPPA